MSSPVSFGCSPELLFLKRKTMTAPLLERKRGMNFAPVGVKERGVLKTPNYFTSTRIWQPAQDLGFQSLPSPPQQREDPPCPPAENAETRLYPREGAFFVLNIFK